MKAMPTCQQCNRAAGVPAEVRLALVFAALMVGGAFGLADSALSVASATVSPFVEGSKRLDAPRTLAALLQLKPEVLEQYDLATMNLLCADGLREAEDLKVESSLETLDAWTRHVAAETTRNLHRFAANPKEYGDSLPYYRMMLLATVLQQDFGTLYNPERARPQLRGDWEPNDSFFADSKDVFLHGLLGGKHLGTCSSLPVLYVAVAQRLGYPVHLAAAKGHFYVRYDDGDEHLNVEATSLGFNTYPDEHYRHWPLPTTGEEARQYGLLRPLSNREALGAFLTIRANCLTSMKQFEAAAEAWAQAARLLPKTSALEGIVARAQARANHEAAASRWDALWDQVAGLAIPFGPDARRFRERQYQVQTYMNQSTNLAEIESVVAALESELQAHRRQAMLDSDPPAHAALRVGPPQSEEPPGPATLELQSAAILRFRIAAERVPHEYWQGIPADLEPQLRGLTTEEQVVAEMWKYHADRLNQANLAAFQARAVGLSQPSSATQGVPGSPAGTQRIPGTASTSQPVPATRQGATPFGAVGTGHPQTTPPALSQPALAATLPDGNPITIEIIPPKPRP